MQVKSMTILNLNLLSIIYLDFQNDDAIKKKIKELISKTIINIDKEE